MNLSFNRVIYKFLKFILPSSFYQINNKDKLEYILKIFKYKYKFIKKK